jgi:hypothetical protein
METSKLKDKEGTIKMDIRQTGWKDVKWNRLTLDRNQWQACGGSDGISCTRSCLGDI